MRKMTEHRLRHERIKRCASVDAFDGILGNFFVDAIWKRMFVVSITWNQGGLAESISITVQPRLQISASLD